MRDQSHHFFLSLSVMGHCISVNSLHPQIAKGTVQLFPCLPVIKPMWYFTKMDIQKRTRSVANKWWMIMLEVKYELNKNGCVKKWLTWACGHDPRWRPSMWEPGLSKGELYINEESGCDKKDKDSPVEQCSQNTSHESNSWSYFTTLKSQRIKCQKHIQSWEEAWWFSKT